MNTPKTTNVMVTLTSKGTTDIDNVLKNLAKLGFHYSESVSFPSYSIIFGFADDLDVLESVEGVEFVEPSRAKKTF